LEFCKRPHFGAESERKKANVVLRVGRRNFLENVRRRSLDIGILLARW
jgi:hypothetical protein